jgi:hypothetical protein
VLKFYIGAMQIVIYTNRYAKLKKRECKTKRRKNGSSLPLCPLPLFVAVTTIVVAWWWWCK